MKYIAITEFWLLQAPMGEDTEGKNSLYWKFRMSYHVMTETILWKD